MNTLLRTGMPEDTITRAAKYIEPLQFDHPMDRSVMGTLNQLAADVEHQLWYDNKDVGELLPYSTSAWLSERPCHVKWQKDCIWPIDSMKAVLQRVIH